MTSTDQFYKKSTLVLLGIILLVYALYILTDILVPIAFSLLLAILLNPLNSRLMRLKIPPVLSILLTLLVAMVVVGVLLYLLSAQIMQFGEMVPALKLKFTQILTQIQNFAQNTFGISIQKQTQFLKETANSGTALLGKTVSSVLGIFSLLFLIPVYVFLFLLYKPLILNFLFEVFSYKNSHYVAEILHETKSAVQSYIVGLLIEASIVAFLNSAALLLLGVPYAILLGVIGAILNMIPYVGGVIAILLPVLMATVSSEGYTTQLGIIGAYAVIQFLDNNVLVPRIVSSKVQINALISILAVLLGGALWGVSGMFLSIPLVAVLKIIFDRIEYLQPWGRLLGDQIPASYPGQASPAPALAREEVPPAKGEVVHGAMRPSSDSASRP
ncbi:AI-2E family transporter [Rufibacter glacialis]|uniref:AI-2E family transporter n=1 Tax=Rufibacter glacialis TaxID=1259555 RepID=A0A5M8Q9G9_9BACT|nr:AI-2E family transporter [Rufibacter glacialis]KAA6432559.1 AI-2E family transporter [Rufibacter glacialis]GGK79808.1 AI-2E family transporter [Rufibacter glacialis]